MACRIDMNGFGRIGLMVLRRSLELSEVEVVAINDLAPIGELAYLLKYDSVHGFLREDVSNDEAPSTSVVEGTMAKRLAWYDNEWGYSCRLVDLAGCLALS